MVSSPYYTNAERSLQRHTLQLKIHTVGCRVIIFQPIDVDGTAADDDSLITDVADTDGERMVVEMPPNAVGGTVEVMQDHYNYFPRTLRLAHWRTEVPNDTQTLEEIFCKVSIFLLELFHVRSVLYYVYYNVFSLVWLQ